MGFYSYTAERYVQPGERVTVVTEFGVEGPFEFEGPGGTGSQWVRDDDGQRTLVDWHTLRDLVPEKVRVDGLPFPVCPLCRDAQCAASEHASRV